MSRNKTYLIVQAALWALAAAWMAAMAIRMYVEGAAIQASGELFYYIYTREKVGEALRPMLPLIFGAVGMTVAGWILGVKDERADKPVQDAELVRNLTVARVQNPGEAMLKARDAQRKLHWGGWIAFALCMVPVAVYVFNGAHFDRPRDTEADLFALLKVFVPWTALGIAALAVTGVMRERRFARETEAAKAQLAEEKAAGVAPGAGMVTLPAVAQDSGRGMWILRGAVLILAVILIVAGVRNGGLEDVLTKANAICMECVGLG